jgi:hypothetical protein
VADADVRGRFVHARHDATWTKEQCVHAATQAYTVPAALQHPARPGRIEETIMMWNINVEPNAALAGVNTAPLFETWNRIAGLYREATQASMQQLWLSSANIIQEHTMRALMAAAQSCAEALAQNAVEVQQQSMARFMEVNQKAASLMGSAVTEAWMPRWRG